MRHFVSWSFFIIISIGNILGQDTIRFNCSQRLIGLTQSPSITIKILGNCDSIFLLNSSYYHFLLNESKNFKEFYCIFQQYKSTRKSTNTDITDLINDYEKILNTKDDAYSALLKEYEKVNKLLDNSIDQNKRSLAMSESSFKEIKDISTKLQLENQQLEASIERMKKITAKEKLKAGIKYGIIGGGIALIVGGILGYTLVH